jgi:hypothetical protein
LGEGRGEGVGDLLLAAAGLEGEEVVDPGLDVGAEGPGEGGGGGEVARGGEGEEVAAGLGEGVEEGLVLGGEWMGGCGDHEGNIRLMNGMSSGV